MLRDLPEHHLKAGDLGAIVHRPGPDTVDVEFVRGSGHTQAVVTLCTADLPPLTDHDLVAARPIDQGKARAQVGKVCAIHRFHRLIVPSRTHSQHAGSQDHLGEPPLPR
jgi:hypothetical protein